MKPPLVRSCTTPRKFVLHLYLAIGLLLGTVLTLHSLLHAPVAPPLQPSFQTLPMRIGTWEGTEERLEPHVITMLGLDDWILRQYQREAGTSVWFYAGFLAYLYKEKQHHSPQICYNVHGWNLLHSNVQQVSIPGESSINVHKILVQKGSEQQWVLYWLQRGENVVTTMDIWEEYRWRLTALWRLTPVPRGQTLVLVAAPVRDTSEEALARAIAFVQAMFPRLSDLVRHG